MAVKVGGLLVDLDMETASFLRDMGKARRAVESNGTKINRALARTQKGLKRFRNSFIQATKSMLPFNASILSVAGAAGIGFLIKRSLDAADNIGKTADSIGISTDALQEYRFAASIAGVETSALDGAFQAATKRFGELRQGTGTLVTILDKMDV